MFPEGARLWASTLSFDWQMWLSLNGKEVEHACLIHLHMPCHLSSGNMHWHCSSVASAS